LQSTVCQKIVEALAQNSTDVNIRRRVEIISQDCFYRPLTEAQKIAAAKGQFDFDHPGTSCCNLFIIISVYKFKYCTLVNVLVLMVLSVSMMLMSTIVYAADSEYTLPS